MEKVTSSLTLPGGAPTGRYDVYLTYQDAGGEYHDGPSGFVDVNTAAAPPAVSPSIPPSSGSGPVVAAPIAVSLAGGLQVRLAALRGGLTTLRAAGLRLPVSCSAACEVSARLLYGGHLVSRGVAARLRAGTAVVVLRASRAGKRFIRGVRVAPLSLKLSISDGSGHSRTVTRVVRLRG